ncbi:MAG TPA: Ig-like domain-containing protein, partial [Phnomibacter sp.]|nr:Ig-like domain-containing protein [Phnomibacter sp.]
MKKIIYNLLICVLVLLTGCQKRDISELQPPQFPSKGEVFIDDFTDDLQYAAFGGSDVRAFEVDKQVGYGGSAASMRFAVPDANSSNGSYAGGVFYSTKGRNLSGFNALTFYIKASQPATIGVVGFGDDLAESKYRVAKNGLLVNTNWKKVIIPIPDPSKLTAEKGLLYYAAAPENDRGYTFWIDEVRFEKITTIANVTGMILNGQDRVTSNAENGDTYTIGDLMVRANMPDGVNETAVISPYYFTFTSSSPSVATVGENGTVTVGSAGTTNITATLGGGPAEGSWRITSVGAPVLPLNRAPVPNRPAVDVISLYSNAYTNVPIGTWNTRWQFSTAEESFVQVQGDDMIRYRNLNFVGIEFTDPTINASSMQAMHMDIWTPNPTELPNNFKILLVDFGPDNAFGGGDDSQHEVTITRPTLVSNNWVSIDIPFSQFTGLTRRANLAQMVLSGSIPDVFVDNVYFYRNPVNPPGPAPVPTAQAANVLSIFSDSYTNVAGTDFNPNWGQSTVVTQTPIAGNNTLYYRNFNYQGIQLAGSVNASTYQFLHLDYYTTNATELRIFLVSPGPVETSFTLNVPTAGWQGINIPLTAFSPVALNNIIQIKFEGSAGSDIFLDNIYFLRLPVTPATPAPTPTYPAAQVTSIFSDAYTNVAGTNLNPGWGQNTVTTVMQI